MKHVYSTIRNLHMQRARYRLVQLLYGHIDISHIYEVSK